MSQFQESPLQGELLAALADPTLETIDLHGMYREDVRREIHQLIVYRPNECVRIIFGTGQGILAREVIDYLKQLQKNGRIQGFQEDTQTASVVVKVAAN